ncbi:MAG TPA: hypothetical protein VIT42_05915 [Microlunatus sp.]
MTWPLMPAASSEARNAIRPATSPAVPNPTSLRKKSGIGSPASSAATAAAKYGTVLVIAVAATGMTAFTHTPDLRISSAQVRTMPTMPALAAA